MENLPDDWFERFELGIREFNDEQFFECHETLERCWQEQGVLEAGFEDNPKNGHKSSKLDPPRQWVQGVIQISVAYHHLRRGNVKGALKLFHRGYGRIKNFPLITYPLEIGPFEATVKATMDELEAQPEPDLARYQVRFPKIAAK